MLPYPYPDELCYGFIGRLRTYCLSISSNQLAREIFGTTRIVASPDLLCGAQSLADYIDSKEIDAGGLIWRHTLLPYYVGFSPKPVRKAAFYRVLNGQVRGLHLQIGMGNSRVRHPGFFRYCPSCWKESEADNGEVFIKRLFQLPGVLVCPKHMEPLHETSVPYYSPKKLEYHLFSPSDATPHAIEFNNEDEVARAWWVATDSERLLGQAERDNPRADVLVLDYRHALQRLGLAVGKNVYPRALEEAFLGMFPMEFLAHLGLSFEIGKESNWLRSMARVDVRNTHPLLHLLFRRFVEQKLGEDCWNALFDERWPCFNPLMPHPGPVDVALRRLQYEQATKAWKGWFECSCGFQYTGIGCGQVMPETMRVSKVTAQAFALKMQVMEMFAKGLSGKAISRQLHVDYNTVMGIRRLEHKGWRKQTKSIPNQEDRERWLELMAQNSGNTISQLRAKAGALYSRLYKYDKEWLRGHFYPRASAKTCSGKTPLQWSQTDAQLSVRIAELAAEIRARRPPQRVTMSRISRELNVRNVLRRSISHLPRCKKALVNCFESLEGFQLRRLELVFPTRPVWGSRSQLMRAAGLLESCVRPAAVKRVSELLNLAE